MGDFPPEGKERKIAHQRGPTQMTSQTVEAVVVVQVQVKVVVVSTVITGSVGPALSSCRTQFGATDRATGQVIVQVVLVFVPAVTFAPQRLPTSVGEPPTQPVRFAVASVWPKRYASV